jgi:alanine racemase
MYRNTSVYINLNNIKNNVKKVIEKCNNYKYYIGVVKADSYGHCDNKVVKAIVSGGCNYLATATLDEALEIREDLKDIPILCLGIIDEQYIDVCIKNDITITVDNCDYVKAISNKNAKVHIKINTGMNRLGTKTKEEFNKIYRIIQESNLILEGIYTHMYSPDNLDITKKQEELFEYITGDIDLKTIPMIHLGASEYTLNYPKKEYVNTCRLGIIMYGLVENNLNLESTFRLESEIIKINKINNETVGYGGNYKADKEELIAVVPIGYADGIIRKNTGRTIFINNKEYKIVGNICMDMLFVKVDESVSLHDKVVILKDINHIIQVADYLETIPYEIICSISKRVPRIYVGDNDE